MSARLQREYGSNVAETRRFGRIALAEGSQDPGFGPGCMPDCFQLQLCIVGSGRAEINFGGHRLHTSRLRPGMIGLSPANTACDYFLSEYSRLLIVPLPATLVRAIVEQIQPEFGEDFGRLHHSIFREPNLARQVLSMWRSAACDRHTTALFADTQLLELLASLIQQSTASKSLSEKKLSLTAHILHRVLDFIDSNLDSDLALSALSKVANLSEFHFLRAFKAEMGVTPHQYVLDQRLQRAKTRLEKSGANVADIAMDCGFASHQHLSTVFRRVVGHCPSEHRKRSTYGLH
jgi:AraC family transcriptional regulator